MAKNILGLLAALALVGTAGTAHAYTVVNCRVSSVAATSISQTYVQCVGDPNGYSLLNPDKSQPSDAAIARFLSLGLAALLSGRTLQVSVPDGWTCADGNCSITGFKLI